MTEKSSRLIPAKRLKPRSTSGLNWCVASLLDSGARPPYTYIDIPIYTYLYIYLSISLSIYQHIYKHVFTYVYTCMYVCMYVSIYIYIYISIYLYIYIYVYHIYLSIYLDIYVSRSEIQQRRSSWPTGTPYALNPQPQTHSTHYEERDHVPCPDIRGRDAKFADFWRLS